MFYMYTRMLATKVVWHNSNDFILEWCSVWVSSHSTARAWVWLCIGEHLTCNQTLHYKKVVCEWGGEWVFLYIENDPQMYVCTYMYVPILAIWQKTVGPELYMSMSLSLSLSLSLCRWRWAGGQAASSCSARSRLGWEKVPERTTQEDWGWGYDHVQLNVHVPTHTVCISKSCMGSTCTLYVIC